MKKLLPDAEAAGFFCPALRFWSAMTMERSRQDFKSLLQVANPSNFLVSASFRRRPSH
jgi:hypothetical protein